MGPLGAGAASAKPAKSSPGLFQQLKMPWQADRRPARKTKRPAQPRKGKPAPRAVQPTRGAKPAAGALMAAPPADEVLPAPQGPPTLAPRAATRSAAEGWRLTAEQAPAPVELPPLPPGGPAPASAAVLALYASMRVADLVEPPSDAEDDDEVADLHVPLPPVRPGSPEGVERPVAIDAPPLPPRRPGEEVAALSPAEPPAGPTAPAIELPVVAHDDDADCRALAVDGTADVERIPPIEGPGVCGGGPLVLMKGVKLKDGGHVRIAPAAVLRCSMAAAVAAYLRDDVGPAAEATGAALTRVEVAGSFQCRGRNGARGGKMSEHGRANAIDLASLGFADGRSLGVFAPDLPEKLASVMKTAACERFSTILGPGSDGFHESHLHLDLQPRRSKSRLCQWNEPAIAASQPGVDQKIDGPKPQGEAEEPKKASANIPLPPERGARREGRAH